MSESKLRAQSLDFAVSIINLVKYLKEKRESIISNQIGRSGTSIGADIREAQYKALDSACTSIRVMLISSINTAKENAK